MSFKKTQDLLEHSEIDAQHSGTTLISTLIKKNELYCANVGDSRAIIISASRYSMIQIKTTTGKFHNCPGIISPASLHRNKESSKTEAEFTLSKIKMETRSGLCESGSKNKVLVLPFRYPGFSYVKVDWRQCI